MKSYYWIIIGLLAIGVLYLLAKTSGGASSFSLFKLGSTTAPNPTATVTTGYG